MFHQRKHIRLRNFDYSSSNAYFITVCVKYFEPLLGSIKNGICGLTDVGNETALYLQKIPEIRAGVILDEFIVMPNHLHCLLILPHHSRLYSGNGFGKPVTGSVSVIINQFKGAVTKWCKLNSCYFDWQDRFHDHVVRNEQEYWAVKNYIINNPGNWKDDCFFS
ncbi:MAG TPA: transposase [Flavisolibacter sp.]|jgi:REP element-mobilizing transposase RayT